MDKLHKGLDVPRARWAFKAVAAISVAALLVVGGGTAEAQFNSGSSGAHGVFPPLPESGDIPSNYSFLVWNVRTGGVRYCNSYTIGTGSDLCNAGSSVDVFAQIPNIPVGGLTTGVYEFTDFTISAINGIHRSIVPVGYSATTPLTILSQQDIVLTGIDPGYQTYFYVNGATPGTSTSNFSVAGGRGGPGGFDGAASGNGGDTPGNGSAGFGPSGGAGGRADATAVEGLHGVNAAATPLNPSLTPLTGGSGGGGGAGLSPANTLGCSAGNLGLAGGAGGGGGGALLLAASGRVNLGGHGFIIATGGDGARNNQTGCVLAGGGGGGGSVRIVAQEFIGTGTISVHGGILGDFATRAIGGHVRIEAAFNTFSGNISGAAGGSFLSFPTAAIPSNQPILRITSIAGAAAPQNPSASLAAPDITFTDAIEAPVTLALAASNVPLGTSVNIRVVPATGEPTTATTSGLTGTVANSTAQATVTLPPGAGVVTASATFTIGSSGGGGGGMASNTLPLIDGERPNQVEVVALADGSSHAFLVAASGARFEIGPASR